MARIRAIKRLVGKMSRADDKVAIPLERVPGVRERLRSGAKIQRYVPDEGKMRVVFEGADDVVFDPFLNKSGRLARYAANEPVEVKNKLIQRMMRPYVRETSRSGKRVRQFIGEEGRESFARAATRKVGQAAKDHPVLFGLGAAEASFFLGGVGSEALRPVFARREIIGETLTEEMAIRDFVEGMRRRNSDAVLMRQATIDRLARSNPHLYNELLHGREFASGDMPVGGRPDAALLEAFAELMTQQGATQ